MEDDDLFVFNEGFTAPLYRIKVHMFVMLVYTVAIYLIVLSFCINIVSAKSDHGQMLYSL